MRHYEVTSETYDEQYMGEQNRKMTAALEALPHAIDKNSLVLDAGCGTGLLFPRVAERAKLIVGIDIAPGLLRKARTRAKANVALVRGDAESLPLKENKFNYAFAFTLLQNMPDPKRTLEEVKRATRPDAILAISGLKKHYTETDFRETLENAKLEILTLRTVEELKDFVAVCRKRL